jgi:hypothetical protein
MPYPKWKAEGPRVRRRHEWPRVGHGLFPVNNHAEVFVGALGEAPLQQADAGVDASLRQSHLFPLGALREAPLQIVRVGRPAQWVRPNVFPDFIQFIFIPDDVIVKISLP